jgi:SNF2 family DNA or RNA helicase
MSTNIGMHNMVFLECLLRIRQVMIHPQLYLNGIAKKSGYETPDHWDHKTTKIDRLMELMEEHPNEKTLIFCQFIQEMDIIEEKLEGKPVFRIDGSVDKDARVQQVKGFQGTGGEAYFLIQIKAGGQGLNLQAATRVYITAPSWNPATEMQAIARSHRTGQTQKVYVKKLVGELDADFKGVEDWIVEKQEHKSVICAEVLNDPRLAKQLPSRVNPTMNDIRKIFRV